MPTEISEYGMVVDRERPHLGGYFPEGDPGSYCPEMWTWFVEEYDIRSVIDVGCGSGQALRFFRDLGVVGVGIDGIAQYDPYIIEHDYTTGPWPVRDAQPPWSGANDYDLVWSCEFVEHVEERFMPNFLATFALGRYVLMTHAQPGQGGHHHVNCKDDSYWVGALAAMGCAYDAELTAKTKELTPHGYWPRSGLVFRRASAA